ALDYATYKPERLKTLTIAASGLGLQGDPEYDEYRKRAEIPGMADQPAHIREVSPDYRATNPEGLEHWQVIHEQGQQPGVARAPLLRPNSPDKLTDIRSPSLIIAGGIDLVTPSGAMRLWSRHISAPKKFVVIPEAGHVLVWEQPEVFNQTLVEFLKQH
ncbi:MAG: alpha/beta hydrolase, partial [Gammaproteobacteria bacterium]|nr:alpha/beta hydrolase [Gammaproteobacteria bacterium]